MCRSLVEFGYEVHLVAAGANSECVDGVHISGAVFRGRNRLMRMIFATRAVYKKAVAVDAEIYHIHDPELLPWAVKLQKMGKKVIYDSHEDVPQDILDKDWIRPALLRRAISLAFDQFEKRQALKLSGVISVLESITHKFHHPHSVTIHNYPRLEFFSEQPYIFDVEIASRTKLIYNGGLTQVRCIHNMIAAMGHLHSQYVLLLMGPWESDAYKNQCQGMAGWSKVVDMGQQDLATCMQMLKSSDIGMLLFKPIANHVNSLPNKSFEYLAAGIPAIMSNFDFWIKEFGNYAHFVDPENPAEIAAKVEIIAAHQTAERERALKTSAEILETKTWNHEAQKLREFYDYIISST